MNWKFSKYVPRYIAATALAIAATTLAKDVDVRGHGIIADFLSKSTEERVAIFADPVKKARFRHITPRPEDGPPRFMAVDGVSNMRDIGGWKGLDGRRVRHGLAYRSAAFDTGVQFRKGAKYEYLFELDPVTDDEKKDFKPAKRTITDKGIAELVEGLGIRSDLDLRSPHECYGLGASPLGAGVKWFHCPQKTYGKFGDDDARRAFAAAFRVFLDKSNYPIIFHCAGGADRTGAIAFMVNGICGVALDDLRKDWELTVFGTAHAENPGFTHAQRFDRLVAVVDRETGATLTEKIVSFVKSCGFTDADIERVREIMLSPAPMSAPKVKALAGFEIDRSVMSDAYWQIWNHGVQAKIDADIEKYRKADASIEIAAPDGTEVQVEQVNHAFFFGAHIFNFNQLGKKEWNDRYKELYGTLFNSATVAFYWRTLEQRPYAPRFEERYEDTENFWNSCPQPKEQAHWRRPAPDPVIDFLKTRRCRIHGHPLVWGNFAWQLPTWLWDDFCPEAEKRALEARTGVTLPTANWRIPVGTKDMADNERAWGKKWKEIFDQLSEEEIAAIVPTYIANCAKFYEKRIRDIAERYGDRVDSWDVVNESATDYHVWQGEKAVRGVPCQKSVYGLMPGDYTYKGFQWAQKYLPKSAWLNLNDFKMAPFFFKQAKDLEANGCRVDVVGSQMHLFNPAESVNIARGEGPEHLRPEGIAARFALLSKAGKPIHLSEITITAPDNSPRGQMVQAIIMRNLYRAWFSVEKMNGITWWNVVDDCGAPGEPSISGLFTRDMRPKTAYFAMDDLINREWKMRTAVRAAGGKVSFRGFRGRYRLSWKGADGKEQSKLVEVR